MTLREELESLGYHLMQHPEVGLTRFFLRADVLAIIAKHEAFETYSACFDGSHEMCRGECVCSCRFGTKTSLEKGEIFQARNEPGEAAAQHLVDHCGWTRTEPSEERPAREYLNRADWSVELLGMQYATRAIVEAIDANTAAIREARHG